MSKCSFNLSKQCRPWWNAASCCISSGSSLFAKVPIHGVSRIQRVRCFDSYGISTRILCAGPVTYIRVTGNSIFQPDVFLRMCDVTYTQCAIHRIHKMVMQPWETAEFIWTLKRIFHRKYRSLLYLGNSNPNKNMKYSQMTCFCNVKTNPM